MQRRRPGENRRHCTEPKHATDTAAKLHQAQEQRRERQRQKELFA